MASVRRAKVAYALFMSLRHLLRVWLTRSSSLVVCVLGCGREVPPAAVASESAPAAPSRAVVSPEAARAVLCDLYARLDRDCDKRLTVVDQSGDCERAPCELDVRVTLGGRTLHVEQLHQASQLATDLAEGLERANASAASHLDLDVEHALGNPVQYLERRIDERYWPGLTRTISTAPDELARALFDEKRGESAESGRDWCADLPRCGPSTESVHNPKAASTANVQYLYVPSSDQTAYTLYAPLTQSLPLRVASVPSPLTSAWLATLTRARTHGLLSLAYDENRDPRPFVVPGGRFNEMYGWDSYFISLGLLRSGRLEAARDMAEHQAYEIVHYGKVLNANRTYYLTRSQPPFFAPLVRHVLDAYQRATPTVVDDRTQTGFEEVSSLSRWRAKMLQAAEREYDRVWSSSPRRTTLCSNDVCLARYYGEGVGQPPEVEAGHFDTFYQAHAVEHGHCVKDTATDPSGATFLRCVRELEGAYTSGSLTDPQIDAFFVEDQCVRESGHDTTFRWFQSGKERCTNFATVDLNTLLLQYELDVASLYRQGTLDERAQASRWCARAEERARLIQRYLWDEERGVYFDFDVAGNRRSRYLSATTLYPLWVNTNNVCGVSVVSPAQAQRLVRATLPHLEAPGGLLATAPESLDMVDKPIVLDVQAGRVTARTPARQWEAPNGWAPHQMLAWTGLQQHGFEVESQRLAYRWLLLIAENAANYHGTVPEKFDVVRRTHRVFAEYGNVNTEFAYIAKEGFGWMNASFVVGLDVLTPDQRVALFALKPIESVF